MQCVKQYLAHSLSIINQVVLTIILYRVLSRNTKNANTFEGDPPPLLVRSIQGVFRRYAVRKGWVSSTQKSSYIVRRHQFLLSKSPIFIKKHKTRGIQSQISLVFSRASFARTVRGHLSIYKLKHWFWKVQTRESNTETHQINVWKNDCTCACNRLSFYLLYVTGNAKKGCFCC